MKLVKIFTGSEDDRDAALRGGLTRRRAVSALLQVGALTHPFSWRVLALGSSTTQVEPQPLQAAVRRLVDAMAYLGEPLSDADRARLDAAGRSDQRHPRSSPRSSGSSIPHCLRGGSDQPGEPGLGRARRRAGATRRARLAGVPDQSPQRGRCHGSAERGKPAGAACLPAGDRVTARAAIGASRQTSPIAGSRSRPTARSRWSRSCPVSRSSTASCCSTAAIAAAVRRRSAPHLGAGTADIGFRNRTAVLFDIAPVARRDVARARRERQAADDRVVRHRGQGRPRLPGALEATGAGLLLPGSDLSRRRRDRAPSRRTSSR